MAKDFGLLPDEPVIDSDPLGSEPSESVFHGISKPKPAQSSVFAGSDQSRGQAIGEQRLRLALDTGQSPDEATEALQLQARTGLPVDLIQRNLADIRQEVAREDFDAATFRRESPIVSAFLEERPEYAAALRNDLSRLGGAEKMFHSLITGFERGQATTELSRIGESAITGSITPEQRRRAAEISQQMADMPEYGHGFVAGIPAAFAEQIPIQFRTYLGGAKAGAGGFALGFGIGAGKAIIAGQLGPQAAAPEELVTAPVAGLATGTAFAVPAFRIGMGLEAARMEAGLAYLEFEDLRDESGAPLGRDVALPASLIVGVINGSLEFIGAQQLARTIPGLRALQRNGIKNLLKQPTFRRALQRWGADVLKSMGTEGATEAMQEMVTASAGELATMYQDGTLGTSSAEEILERTLLDPEKLNRSLESGVKGAQGGGGMTMATGSASVLLDARRAKKAQQDAQFFEALGQQMEGVETRQKLPQQLQEILDRVTKDGPVEELYVPMETWSRYWQEQGIDPREAAREVVGDEQRYDQALATGEDLAIPTSRYALTLAPTQHNAFFVAELRTSPEAMNAREAQEWMAEQDKLDTEEPDAPAAPTSAQRVTDDVAAQLRAAGFDDDSADRQARLYGAVFGSLGERTGVDPMELFQRYGLRIQRPLPEVLQRSDRVDDLDSLLDRLRSGDIPRQQDVFGVSLLEFLRPQGLVDQGGELAARDLDAGRQPFQRKLVREGGLALDRAAEMAAEAGYIPERDINALLAAIDSEQRGEAQFSQANQNEPLLQLRTDLEDLEAFLGEIGIDLQEMTDNAAVKARLDEIAAQEVDGGQSFEQSAYHGTGFSGGRDEFGRFRTDQIGGPHGEGAQAFGWGLYFTSERGIADAYRNALRKGAHATVDGEARFYSASSDPGERFAVIEVNAQDGDIDAALSALESRAQSEWSPPESAQALAWLRENRDRVGYRPASEGRLATVDIPESDDLLQWDKPLSEQPEKVLAALSIEELADVIVQRQGLTGNEGPLVMVQSWFESERFTGSDLYAYLQRNLGSDRAASEWLARAGIPGLEYPAGSLSGAQSDARNFVIWDDALIDIKEFEQAQGRTRRGAIRFGPDRQFSIDLFEKANLSTFLHESGHFYLEVLGDLAQDESAPQQIRDDYSTLLTWLGAESRDAIGTPQHEQFARGFEAYLMEGKAPSDQLRSIFARFRAWLVSIYRNLRALDVELTDEVRGVMDRLVATEQEIASAAAAQNVQPLFTDPEQAAMTPDAFAAYQAAVAEARQEAEEELSGKLMREHQREAAAWWREAREQVAGEVEAETNTMREYVALAVLSRSQMPDGSPLPDGMQPIHLDRRSLVEAYGEAFLKRLPRPYVYRREGGISPDAAADILGFRSGDELVMTLANIRPKRQVIEAETDIRMRERYGDLMTDGRLPQEAMEALHNEKRGDLLVRELTALGRRTGRRQAPVEMLRERARERIARTRIRDLKPDAYRRAEAQAARKAFTALAEGKHEEALRQKQRELLNHHLYREAIQAREDSDKAAAYLRSFDKGKKRAAVGKAGSDYLEQIDQLLEQYEFRRTTLRRLDRRQSLGEWLLKQEAEGLPHGVPDEVLLDARRVNWRELEVEFLQGLTDAVKAIEHLARFKDRLMRKRKQQDLEIAVGEAVAGIEDNLPPLPPSQISGDQSPADRGKERFAGILAAHRKMSSYARQMDGGKSGGVVWDLLVRPLNEAADREITMRSLASEAQAKLWDAWRERGNKKLGNKVHIPAINRSLTLETRLAIALNWGNAGNRDRLMRGENWTAAQVESILETLDADDWALVQGIWDQIEAYWPEIAEKQRRVTGLVPEKVDAEPVQTRFGRLRGGYYPIAYDSGRASKSAGKEAETAAKLYQVGQATRATTRRGHTKARAEGGLGTPLRLDLDVLVQHISQVIHDVTHHEAIIDANRIINRPEFREAVDKHLGVAAFRQIKDTIQDVAVSDLADNEVDKALRWMRNGVSVAILGGRLSTALIQIAGAPQSMQLVGWASFGRAIKHLFHDPRRTESGLAFIQGKSAFMAERVNTSRREARETLDQIRGKGWKHNVNVAAYYLIQRAQLMVDLPTWLAGYENALRDGRNEADAVAIADQTVKDTQGSGLRVDFSGVQRSRATQLLTVFYSFFNVLHNRTAESIALARGQGYSPKALAQLSWDFIQLYAIPSAMTVMMREAIGALVGDEDDDETFAAAWMKEMIGMGMGNVLGLRELSGAIEGYRYSGPAGLLGLEAISNLVIQSMQGELDKGLVDAAAEAGGVAFHLPIPQIVRSIEGTMEMLQGDAGPLAPLVGPPKER